MARKKRTKVARKSAGETVIGDIASIHAKIGKNLPFLSIVYPLDNKALFPITEKRQIIGRGQHVAVILEDDLVSREHCMFWLDDDGVVVRDLQSTNGTMIDNTPITEALLTQQSRLLIGDHIFKLEYKNEHELEYDRKLIQAANTDALTGIANRRSLMAQAHSLYAQCRNNDRSIAIIMLDIDHFKRVNDNWGHPAGDMVIKRIAQLLAAHCSSSDLCGRYGGEEFMVLLPDRSPPAVMTFCEALRKKVEEYSFSWGGEEIPITISLGGSMGHGATLPGLDASIAHADNFLYQAKKSGRNRLCCDQYRT